MPTGACEGSGPAAGGEAQPLRAWPKAPAHPPPPFGGFLRTPADSAAASAIALETPTAGSEEPGLEFDKGADCGKPPVSTRVCRSRVPQGLQKQHSSEFPSMYNDMFIVFGQYL